MIVTKPEKDCNKMTDNVVDVLVKWMPLAGQLQKWGLGEKLSISLATSGLTYQKPEKRFKEADEEKRQEWIRKVIPEILETVGKYKAILYFKDESNISLTAVLGKTWAPKGKTPIQRVTGGRSGVAARAANDQSRKLLRIRIIFQFLMHHSFVALLQLGAFQALPPQFPRKQVFV